MSVCAKSILTLRGHVIVSRHEKVVKVRKNAVGKVKDDDLCGTKA